MSNSNQTTTKTPESRLSASTGTAATPSTAVKNSKARGRKNSLRGQAPAGRSRADRSSPLKQSFLTELSALLDAEKQLLEALPKVARAAHDPALKKAVTHHLAETKEHARRIRGIFKIFGEKPAEKTSASMKAILAEARPLLAKRKGNRELDPQIIAAAQKAEHYEIAAYGTLRAWARWLNVRPVWDLISQTLEEEKRADDSLNRISEGAIDVHASEENQNETAHQERSSMPNHQSHRGRSGHGSQERDEHGRFESQSNGRQGSHSSSNHGRSQDNDRPYGRQGGSQGGSYSNEGNERSSDYYGQSARGNFSRGRSQGGPERDENGRFESGSGRSHSSSRSGNQDYQGNQDWNENDNRQGYGRSQQSSQDRERDENGRFQSDEDDHRSQGYSRSQDWNENQGNHRQDHGRSQSSQSRPQGNRGNEYSGSRNWNEDMDYDREDNGNSNSNQGWSQGGDYENEGQRGRRSNRSSREQSSSY